MNQYGRILSISAAKASLSIATAKKVMNTVSFLMKWLNWVVVIGEKQG